MKKLVLDVFFLLMEHILPSFKVVGRVGTLLISCGILSPVYQTFALFVVYAAFPHLTLL